MMMIVPTERFSVPSKASLNLMVPTERFSVPSKVSLKQGMKASKSMERKRASGDASFLREAGMKESGETMKCMDSGDFIMQLEHWLMRESGKTTNFMAQERSIVLNPPSFSNLLTLGTSTILNKNGYLMREVW